MKKLICALLSLALGLSLAACSNWSVEIKKPEDLSTGSAEESESSQSIESEAEEIVKTESGLSSSWQDEELTETDEPSLDVFIRMDAYSGELRDEKEAVSLTSRQIEFIKKLLQPENWTELPENWQGKGGLLEPLQILESDGKGTLYVSPDEGMTLIMLKWGQNQKYSHYYYAPPEVAEDMELFRKNLELSLVPHDCFLETAPELKEYYDKYISGFPVVDDFDEENYFTEINSYHLLYFAYRKLTGNYVEDCDEGFEPPFYPAEFVESTIQKFFLWDSETIRKNVRRDEYDSETNTYYFPVSYGGGYYPRAVTAVRQNGNILEIDVEQYGDHDACSDPVFYLESSYTITVRLDEDGTWKYIGKKTYFQY